METQLTELPDPVRKILDTFVESARGKFDSQLKSVVLYGSAAEGCLRSTSDVNLIMVFDAFEISKVNDFRETLRYAHAAIDLNVMFLLESEIPLAIEAFAVKFIDVFHRHKVLYGADVFRSLTISRSATLRRLQQVILNLMLRLRERYALYRAQERCPAEFTVFLGKCFAKKQKSPRP